MGQLLSIPLVLLGFVLVGMALKKGIKPVKI
jgi:prolipoprotein diacylglyceryltransferase